MADASEIVNRATGKLIDPADALIYLDPGALPDDSAIDHALDNLVHDRPYLAPGPRVPVGSIDQGSRGTDVVTRSPSAWLRTTLRGG